MDTTITNTSISTPKSSILENPWVVLGLLCIMYAMSFFHRASPAVISMDLMETLKMTTANIGLIGSATMLGYAITQIPAGMLSDTLGGRLTLALYQLVAGIGCMVFALSPNWQCAVGARFVMGLALAVNVPALKILATWVAPSMYSKATSVLLTFSTVGTLLASTPLASASESFGWQTSLLGAGLFTVFLASLAFFTLRDRPQTAEMHQTAKKDTLPLKKGLMIIAKEKNFWLVFIWFTMMVANVFVLATMWWGTYLLQGLGFDKSSTGLSLSIMAFIPVVLMPLGAVISDNILHSRKKMLVIGSCISSIGLLTICLGLAPHSFVGITLTGIVIIPAALAVAPLTFTMVKETLPTAVIGTAFGILNSGAPLLAAFAQGLFGTIVDYKTKSGCSIVESYEYAFAMLLVFSIISLVSAIFMKDTLKK